MTPSASWTERNEVDVHVLEATRGRVHVSHGYTGGVQGGYHIRDVGSRVGVPPEGIRAVTPCFRVSRLAPSKIVSGLSGEQQVRMPSFL